MKLTPLFACFVLTVITGGNALAQAKTESLELVMPGGKERLRVEIVVQGESPTAKWNAFLDRWFDYFDADASGLIDRREAARIFPLSVPGNKIVSFAFEKADTNADGKVTRAELIAYYRRAGFTPILTITDAVSLQNLQIADALLRHLGPNANGKLTLESFKRAGELLRKLDENEDEVLTPTELLSFGVDSSLKASTQCDFAWLQTEKEQTGATIRLAFDESEKLSLRIDPVGKSLQLIPSASSNTVARVRHKLALLAFSHSDIVPARGAATSRQFVLAQFKSVVGKTPAIEKRQIEDDPSLQLLADIFPHADRNQDGKLTLTELEQFLGLIEQGVSCPLLVTLTDHGRNLFLHLDTNADGQLDLSELNRASRQVVALGGENGWTRYQIPHCVHITIQQGFAGSAFGPLPLAVPTRGAKVLQTKRVATGPAWFQAMDKNGDGFLSPREFLGPQELFRKLDRDGDGLISVEEAERADALGKSP